MLGTGSRPADLCQPHVKNLGGAGGGTEARRQVVQASVLRMHCMQYVQGTIVTLMRLLGVDVTIVP